MGEISKPHDFFYEAPAELAAAAHSGQTISDWLARELVQPWSAEAPMQTLGNVTPQATRSIFIAMAALVYLVILLSKYAYVFQNWRKRP